MLTPQVCDSPMKLDTQTYSFVMLLSPPQAVLVSLLQRFVRRECGRTYKGKLKTCPVNASDVHDVAGSFGGEAGTREGGREPGRRRHGVHEPRKMKGGKKTTQFPRSRDCQPLKASLSRRRNSLDCTHRDVSLGLSFEGKRRFSACFA